MAVATGALAALVYLKLTSLMNVVRSRLLRIRQPKYLVGAVIGIAYLYFVFFRRYPSRPGSRPGPQFDGLPGDGLSLVLVIGAISLLVFFALCWGLRRQRAALSFTEAEVAFLFPAPLSRSVLIHYRLVSTALASLFTALIMAFFSRRMSGVSPDALVRFAGWWLLFSTVSLHTIGSAFVITRWRDRGISALGCQLMAWAVIAALLAVPGVWLWQQAHAGVELGAGLIEHGPVAWLLYPFRLMLAPLMAADTAGFLQALWPALLLYAAHYWWVLRVQVGFEEASLAKAEKRGRKLAAMRAGNFRLSEGKQKARRAPFNLARAGRPEFAFLWKNLLSTAAYLRLRNALIAAVVIIAGCSLASGHPLFEAMRAPLAMVIAILAAYTMVLGPQLARQDFRSDIQHTDVLRTYPLQGWQIMLGELLAPAAILTGLLWLMLLAAAMLMPAEVTGSLQALPAGMRPLAGVAAALLAPLLMVIQLLVVNAATILFPAWSLNSANRGPQGVEVMGQRLLFMAGQILALAASLVPAVLIAGVAAFALRWVAGDVAATAAAVLAGAAVLVAEIAGGIWLLGNRFEKIDLSQELRP